MARIMIPLLSTMARHALLVVLSALPPLQQAVLQSQSHAAEVDPIYQDTWLNLSIFACSLSDMPEEEIFGQHRSCAVSASHCVISDAVLCRFPFMFLLLEL